MATQYEFKSWGSWHTTYTTSTGIQRQERSRQGRQSFDAGQTWGSWNKYKETRSVQPSGTTTGYRATPVSIQRATVSAPTEPPAEEAVFPSSIPLSEEIQANLRAGEGLHITGGFRPPSAALETIDTSDPSTQFASQQTISRPSATATPEELYSLPGWQKRMGSWGETWADRHEEMALEKQHYIGRDTTGKPIHITESSFQVEFGYSPHDPDYTSVFSDIDANIRASEINLSDWKTNIATAKEYLPSIKENYFTVKNAPSGSVFNVDLNNDGVFETTYTRSELIPILEKSIQVTEEAIATGKDVSSYEKNLRDMRNTRSMLAGYQRLGWEMDVTDKGYSFKLPKASKVHKWYYGEGEAFRLFGVSAMTLGIPTLISGTVTAFTGDVKYSYGELERLTESSMGLTKTKGEDIGSYTARFWTSPEAIESTWIPLATIGLGYGISKLGAVLKGVGGKFIAKIGEKIPTVFSVSGQKIISTGARVVSTAAKPFVVTGKVAGKVLGTKVGQVMFTGGLYGVIEGPGLLETYQEDPARLPSRIGQSLFTWGMAIGGFKAGQKLYKTTHPPTKPSWTELPDEKGKMRYKTSQELLGYDADITVKKISTTTKDFTKSEWWLKEKLYVTDIKSPVDITTRGPYKVGAYGKAITTQKNIFMLVPGDTGLQLQVIPKGTTFTWGKGIIKDPITGKLVKKSTWHVFKTVGTGGKAGEFIIDPITGKLVVKPPLIGTELMIPGTREYQMFWGKGYTKLLSTGDITPSKGFGFLTTGKSGEVTLSKFAKAGEVGSKAYVGKWTKVNKITNFAMQNRYEKVPVTLTKGLTQTEIDYAIKRAWNWGTTVPKSLGEIPATMDLITITSKAKGITFLKTAGYKGRHINIIKDIGKTMDIDPGFSASTYIKGYTPGSRELKFISADITFKAGGVDVSKTISKIYSADISKYVFYGQYKPVGFDVGKTTQFGKLVVITGDKPLTTVLTTQVGKESLLWSEQAAVSLVKPVQPITVTKILSAREIAGGVVGGIGEAVGALPVMTVPSIPALTIMSKPGTILPSVVAGVTRLDVKGEPLLVEKEPVSISKTKPIYVEKSPLFEILGGVKVVEPVKEKRVVHETEILIGGGLKGELEGELDIGLVHGGLVTEPGVVEIEKEEELMGVRTDVDLGMDLWEGQQQKLGLKSLFELKSMQATDLITITPTTVIPEPIVPIIPPTPVPIILFGDPEDIEKPKRKKKPKRKQKPTKEPRIAEGAFLSDLISVTGTQARHKGKATHPALTEEMWKLGEETGFVRMPTVELLEEKKKGKKKKKKLPRLI